MSITLLFDIDANNFQPTHFEPCFVNFVIYPF